jgi:hypothetical protein
MSNHDFTLKSGAKLHITSAPFEDAIALVEVLKKSVAGLDPSLQIDSGVFASPEVRKALYPCFRLALYDTSIVAPSLFDDPKLGERARGDYFEICSRLIEVNCNPFFLKTSSVSTDAPLPTTESQK